MGLTAPFTVTPAPRGPLTRAALQTPAPAAGPSAPRAPVSRARGARRGGRQRALTPSGTVPTGTGTGRACPPARVGDQRSCPQWHVGSAFPHLDLAQGAQADQAPTGHGPAPVFSVPLQTGCLGEGTRRTQRGSSALSWSHLCHYEPWDSGQVQRTHVSRGCGRDKGTVWTRASWGPGEPSPSSFLPPREDHGDARCP